MTAYRIRGWSDSNPSFDFDIEATDYPSLDTCMAEIIKRTEPTSGYARMFETWDEATEEEREDLRDTDSQRVYILYMDPHAHFEEEYEEWPYACRSQTCMCETNDFMITVDIEGE